MILPTLLKDPTALDTVLHPDLRLDTQINAWIAAEKTRS